MLIGRLVGVGAAGLRPPAAPKNDVKDSFDVALGATPADTSFRGAKTLT